MMMPRDTRKACEDISGWQLAASFSVGGFEWLAFSEKQQGKMMIISSQRTTVVDCENGQITDCETVFDEQELTAYCDLLSDEELHLSGQFGGELPHSAPSGEKVTVRTNDKHIMQIFFTAADDRTTQIYDRYDAYICGFSGDGNYFVLADDSGILILKKKHGN